MRFYKVVAVYNNVFRFLLKTVPSFLSVSIVCFTLFHNDVLSNYIFGAIFIFLLSFFITLIYYQFYLKKPAFRHIGAFYINLSMFYAGEAVLLRASSEKIASSFGSLTSTQVLVATGATVGVVAVLETSANAGLAESARIEADGVDRDADRFEKENLPRRAALCRAQSDMVRANDAARY